MIILSDVLWYNTLKRIEMAKKYVDRVIVRLTAEQVQKLKELSETKTVSDVIRRLIEEA